MQLNLINIYWLNTWILHQHQNSLLDLWYGNTAWGSLIIYPCRAHSLVNKSSREMMRPVPSPVWETWNNWATLIQSEALFQDHCLGAFSIRQILWYKVFCCVLWSELGPLSGRINAEDIVTLLPVIEWLNSSIEVWLCIYIFVFSGFFLLFEDYL